MKAGIAIENYKTERFKKALSKGGFEVLDVAKDALPGCTVIGVKYDDLSELMSLRTIIEQVNREMSN